MSGQANRPAIFVLSRETLDLAQRIKDAIEGDIVAIPSPSQATDGTGAGFAEAMRAAFRERRAIVGICASGILIRALADLLRQKTEEPPVIAIAHDCSAIVPLLGGHHGANDLARRIGDALGVPPAITTAGDLAFGMALDAPPKGWRLRQPERAKAAMAALLSGKRARIASEDGAIPHWLAQLPQSPDGEIVIAISICADATGDLVYAPARIALGVGCERLADPDQVIDAALSVLAEANIAREAVACVVSLDLKAAEPAVHALAEALCVPARFFTAQRLEQERHRLANPSEIVFKETGCHGVAEGAALAAAGPDGVLLVPKRVGERMTVAIARAPAPIVAANVGRDRGRLSIVGIGPGDARARTREAERAIGRASDLVGYRLYLELLGDLTEGKRLHGLELGEETERARLALSLAAEGKNVALVSSGDAGIYAMASLIFELIDRESNADWARLDIRSMPGVSAMQTAAARIGAPLGHDFCAISLSDLLTPWETIEARLIAAAESDFVVAFYNPVSQRRTSQLARAREILLRHRARQTPVVLARNLGREGEIVRLVNLGDLSVEDVDMLTIVIVGASTTRVVERPDGGHWVYTPRGYDRKSNAKAGAAR